MKRALIVAMMSICGILSLHAQTPDTVALAKLKTAALVVHATTSVSCGDGSEGACVRYDPDIIAKVTAIVEGTEIWTRFEKADATKADAIFEFTVTDATTNYGRIEFNVRDADSNKILYFEYRDVVILENDVTRIVGRFLKVVGEAKQKPRDANRH